MPGVVFGLIDNGIMIAGAFWGLSIENLLPVRLRKGLGAIIGAGVGNAVSDFFGGVGEGDLPFAVGTFAGCIMALALIPIIYKLKGKKST